MKKLYKYELGFVALVPVLVIAAILFLSLSISSFKKNTPSTSVNKVLGDSNEGSPNPTEVKTPEPQDTPEVEVKDTPEPTHTPEVEIETEVKDGTRAAKIKIHSGDAFQFEQNGLQVEVQGKTPLSVNPTTKELTVTTPAGAKTVATLPNQAVQNLINSGVLSSQSNINLITDSNGNPVYEINGVKYEKLLGLFTVAIDKTGQVSATSGQVIGVTQSTFSKLLDSLSF